MKKLFAILLAFVAVFSLAACSKKEDKKDDPTPDPTPEVTNVTYTVGMGVVTSLDSSSNKTDAKAANAQVDSTFAAVVLDAQGKIVACRLDAVQNKMSVTDGAVVTDATYQTKMEKGDNYNMVKYSEATKEWYDQAKFFESYVVGMTKAQVEAIETKVRDDGLHDGYIVAADATLFAGCSIQITDFKEAIAKACADEQGTTFTVAEGTAFTLGVAATSTGAESTAAVAATAEAAAKDANVKMYSEFAAVVMVDGKIAACLTDAIQPVVAVSAAGEITAKTYRGTKRELKEGYNMVKYSEATKEWYEQAKAFTDYVVGKTKAEVEAIATRVRGAEEAHPGYVVAADETLFASCSIQITGFKAVIAVAVDYAR